MSIAATGLMKQQLMKEPLDTTPEAGMEGNVNRPSMAEDLTKAMNDVDFRNLIEQYSAMAGVGTKTPMADKFMQEERNKFNSKKTVDTQKNVVNNFTTRGQADFEQQKQIDLSTRNPSDWRVVQAAETGGTMENPYNTEFVGLGADRTNLFGYRVPDEVIAEQEERARNISRNFFNWTPPNELTEINLLSEHGQDVTGNNPVEIAVPSISNSNIQQVGLLGEGLMTNPFPIKI